MREVGHASSHFLRDVEDDVAIARLKQSELRDDAVVLDKQLAVCFVRA